jgi:hypothetical protein
MITDYIVVALLLFAIFSVWILVGILVYMAYLIIFDK